MAPELVKDPQHAVEQMKEKQPMPSDMVNQNADMIAYLENDILPKARRGSFTGAVPTMVDGKFVLRKVNTVAELETLISEMKNAKVVALAPSTLPKPAPTPTPSNGKPIHQSEEPVTPTSHTKTPPVSRPHTTTLLSKVKNLFKKS